MIHKDIAHSNITSWQALSWITVFLFPFLGIFAVIKMNKAKRKLVNQMEGAQQDFDIARKLIMWTFIICLIHFVLFVCIFLGRLPD